MKTLALVIALLASSTANAGLVFFDFNADATATTGVASAHGFVDTIANTFVLDSITVPTVFPTRSPVLPLTFFAVTGPSLLAWDVPDNATAQNILDDLNTFNKGFLISGKNGDHAWNPNTAIAINNTMGWGLGVQNRTTSPTIQWTGTDTFQRVPAIATNGITFIDWTVNGNSGVTASIAAVPEPSSFLLIGFAIVGAMAFQKLKRKPLDLDAVEQELLATPENWDSYGGKKPDQECIELAIDLAKEIRDKPMTIANIATGGVMVMFGDSHILFEPGMVAIYLDGEEEDGQRN